MSDLKHACRMLAKSPGFAAVVVLTLALGIGANTAVFSVIDGVLLRPLPYKDPGRLVDILDTSVREKGLAKIFASYQDLEEYSKDARTLQRVGANTWAGRFGAILTGRGPAKSYLTVPVTWDFFGTLGVAAERGRTFTADDLRGGCAVVLSNKFWRGPLGGDPGIAGHALTLDNRPCAVMGVMPARFGFYPPETQIWTLLLPDDPRLKQFFGVFMVARLRPGVTIAQAQAELTALHSAMHSHDVNGEKDFAPLVSDLQDQFTWLAGRNLRTTLAILFVAVALVLFIACLNVANLLLGRSFARGREFAIRAALGSGRARLVRSMLVEAALLSIAGAAIGLLLAFGAIRYFVLAQPIELPVGSNISMNLATLLFTALLSIVTTLVFGIAPAWSVARADVFDGLRATGPAATPGRLSLSRLLVAAEMALSLALLAGAGLLMRSVLNFGSAPLGFSPGHLLVSSGTLPQQRYPDSERKWSFYDRLMPQLQALAGIESVAIASNLPPYGLGLNTLEIQGEPVPRDRQMHDVGQAAVGNDYFRVLRVALRSGRVFDEHDKHDSEPVAVVNEALAREYFPGRNPIGQSIRVGDERTWLTIVGIAATERRPQVFEEMSWTEQPAVYRPLAQDPPEYFSIAARVAGDQSGIGHAVNRSIASIDVDVATGDLETMDSRIAVYLKYPRFRAVVLAVFASLAVLLAAIGLYGIMAQFVTQRTREIGVRMAIGAARSDILRWIARQGGVPLLAGVICGVALTVALTRYLSSLLYGVTSTDPLTFVAVVVIMLVSAIAAMILPARRASRVDPMIALRNE